MAIAMLFEVPGLTPEQYDAVAREVSLPAPGQIFHLAGPMEGGWRVLEVWESQEAADTFYRERLGQALQKNAGITDVQPKVFQVHNIVSA
jgi:hypothetical protein